MKRTVITLKFWVAAAFLTSKGHSCFVQGGLIMSHETMAVAVRSSQLDAVKQPDDCPLPNAIVVQSSIDLPFSAEVAFDAFSDLPRQPTWSPWLRSVEFLHDDPTNPFRESKWTMRYLGVSFSWNSKTTRSERPFLIEWESIKGLKNCGHVDFHRGEGDNTSHMTMKMTFSAPRIAARLFGARGNALSHIVENKMIHTTLQNFRDIVMEVDVKGKQQEPATPDPDVSALKK